MDNHELDLKEHVMMLEVDEKTPPEVTLDDKTEKSLLDYLLARLNSDRKNREDRIRRFALMDQHISTWQVMSPEDTKRDQREEVTGRSQALPMNLPITKAHIDDAVAFYAEVFAPLGGNFYANPGQKKKTESVKKLTRKMEQDTKINQFYMHVCSVMRSLNKYNFGGFYVRWVEGTPNADSAAKDATGNACEAIDVYNFMFDPSIADVTRLHYEGEWSAMMRVRNRLWLMRMHKDTDGGIRHYEEILNGATGSNTYEYGKAQFFKHPPRSTNLNEDGSDSKSGEYSGGQDIDWQKFNMQIDSDAGVEIDGYEVINMHCWINPKQFDLGEEDAIELWQFTICDSRWIIAMTKIEDALYLPTYVSRLNLDDMLGAERSQGELLKPFQRLTSFLVNTHVEGIRSAIWGIIGIDPDMFDKSQIQNGETSAILNSKKPGRDVRTGMMKLNTAPDTKQNLQDAASVMDLMKQLFPNQGLPSQIAGMDRAVSSQVSAVLQGAMRKLHMFVRNLDTSLMLPVRQAQYRNVAMYDPDKTAFADITPEEVAELLASGLGQITREAAAEQIRTIIFALIQNPDGAQGVDIRGLFTLWSALLNIGTDLGEFILQEQSPIAAPGEAQPADPNAPQPGAAASPMQIPMT